MGHGNNVDTGIAYAYQIQKQKGTPTQSQGHRQELQSLVFALDNKPTRIQNVIPNFFLMPAAELY